MNGLALHGLDHLSATSLNLWAAEPALWVVEKLLRRRVSAGCAAHRGTAAEHGVSLGLFEPEREVADCQAAALAEFDRLAALSPDPNKAKERDAIPGIVAAALAELRQYGPPTPPPEGQRQHRVELRLSDVPVPVIGYQDFVWDRGHRRPAGVPNPAPGRRPPRPAWPCPRRASRPAPVPPWLRRPPPAPAAPGAPPCPSPGPATATARRASGRGCRGRSGSPRRPGPAAPAAPRRR